MSLLRQIWQFVTQYRYSHESRHKSISDFHKEQNTDRIKDVGLTGPKSGGQTALNCIRKHKVDLEKQQFEVKHHMYSL